jgi:hypothetical protein
LINSKVGDSFTFLPGPRLEAGLGPVATAVVNVRGSSQPDLLIADSGSNQVLLLQGIGNGFFNDQNPTVFSVGTNPTALLVGQFTAGAGTDFVTINSGSNDVTLVSGLGSGSIQIQTISSGGLNPTTAFGVPVTGNGLDSLVVANNGNGYIALLEANEAGLTLASILSAPGVPNPSALALSSFSTGEMEFYASNEGESSASLLGFQLEESGGASSVSLSSSTGSSAQLVSLNETSLALIGSLLTVTLEPQNESEQSVESTNAQVASTGPGAAGQSLIGQSRASDDLDETDGDPSGGQSDNSASTLTWARFVTGVDQAIETLRDEADARLRQEQEPAKPATPGSSKLEQDPASRRTEANTPVELTAIGRIEALRDRFEAVDLAVCSLDEELARPLQTILRHAAIDGARVIPSQAAQVALTNAHFDLSRKPEIDRSQFDIVPDSRLTTIMAISAITMAAHEILLGRAGRHRRQRLADFTRTNGGVSN